MRCTWIPQQQKKVGGGNQHKKMYSILFLSFHFHVHLVIAVQVFIFLHIIKLFEQIKYHLGKMQQIGFNATI